MKAMAKDLALAGEKYLGKSYQEMDCQAFVELCLRDVGISLNLPGSNAWYRKMTWVGSPEECQKRFGSVPIGAFLFILASDGKEPANYREDGIGNASHIGIKTGRGEGAIHSSATRGHVAESVFKDKTIRDGWNRVGLWEKLDYGERVNQFLENDREGANRAGWDSVVPPEASDRESERGNETLKALVHSMDGNPVKMRSTPSRNEKLWWNIQNGTTVTILEQGQPWSRIQAGERTGYMLTSFLRFQKEAPMMLSVSVPAETAPGLKKVLEEMMEQLQGGVKENDDL